MATQTDGPQLDLWLVPFTLHTPHQAFEDGPDRGFRNVGKTQSDAGEIPKKKTYTRFRIWRKFEIKDRFTFTVHMRLPVCIRES
jgi:hypothetical protein